MHELGFDISYRCFFFSLTGFPFFWTVREYIIVWKVRKFIVVWKVREFWNFNKQSKGILH